MTDNQDITINAADLLATGDQDATDVEQTNEAPKTERPPTRKAAMAAETKMTAKVPEKKKAAEKQKKTAAADEHPPYAKMITAAISELGKTGTSKAAIMKYILANYNVADNKKVNNQLNMALRRGVANGSLTQVTGTGASGSFKLGNGNAIRNTIKVKIQSGTDKMTKTGSRAMVTARANNTTKPSDRRKRG